MPFTLHIKNSTIYIEKLGSKENFGLIKEK